MDEKHAPTLEELTADTATSAQAQPVEAHTHDTIPPSDPEAERQVRLALQEAAARNAQLLHEIEETEPAVSALQGQQARLETLREELMIQHDLVVTTSSDADAQFRVHKSYQDSIAKRWYYIITKMRAKFREKAQAEQERYLQALQRKADAAKRQQDLQQDLTKIEAEGREIEPQVKHHGEAHEQIDALYESIFAGPTPGFPDEDEREAKRMDRQGGHDRAVERLKCAFRSQKQIGLLKNTLERAKYECGQALQEVEYSLFSPDGAYIWLRRCDRFIELAVRYAHGLRKVLPEPVPNEVFEADERLTAILDDVHSVLGSTIATESILPGRSALLQAVEQCKQRVEAAFEQQAKLGQMLGMVERAARDAVRNSARRLEDSRQALQEIRQLAFEIVAGFGAAAPPYNECCDRARGYEGDAVAACQRLPVPTVDELDNLPDPPTYERATVES